MLGRQQKQSPYAARKDEMNGEHKASSATVTKPTEARKNCSGRHTFDGAND